MSIERARELVGDIRKILNELERELAPSGRPPGYPILWPIGEPKPPSILGRIKEAPVAGPVGPASTDTKQASDGLTRPADALDRIGGVAGPTKTDPLSGTLTAGQEESG